jgi:hypothetical protein
MSEKCGQPRLFRTWICTGYLFATQTGILNYANHDERKILSREIQRFKSDRKRLENEFIRVIS